MLIGAYGMFWDLRSMTMHPGSGASWELLGRIGTNRPGVRICDFRRARGVYILFDNHGAYYAGLARGAGGLGERIKKHTEDRHADKWSRFCWFSFDAVSDQPTEFGWHRVVYRRDPVPTQDEIVMRELEAMLITVLNTRGQNKMKFQGAEQWLQVPDAEWHDWVAKVAVDQ